MDKDFLVSSGHKLIRLLDNTKLTPRAAAWVYNPDNNVWRLWLVPDKALSDIHEFYRILADVFSKHREELSGLDIGDVLLVAETHPAIRGMRDCPVPDLGVTLFSENVYNGFIMPSGYILRMTL